MGPVSSKMCGEDAREHLPRFLKLLWKLLRTPGGNRRAFLEASLLLKRLRNFLEFSVGYRKKDLSMMAQEPEGGNLQEWTVFLREMIQNLKGGNLQEWAVFLLRIVGVDHPDFRKWVTLSPFANRVIIDVRSYREESVLIAHDLERAILSLIGERNHGRFFVALPEEVLEKAELIDLL